MKKHVPVWLWYVLAVLLVLADQEVKLWVRTNMTLGEARPFLPHFIELLYVENTGAAFSLLSRFTWLLAILSGVVTVLLVLALLKDWFTDGPFSRLCVTLVLAGAAGNLIDRVGRGKVTDMFNFTFVTFGVFNVADICVVGGVIGYAAWLLHGQLTAERAAKAGGSIHEADADSAH